MKKTFEEKITALPFYISDEYKEFIKTHPEILQSNYDNFENHKKEMENRYGINKHGFALYYMLDNEHDTIVFIDYPGCLAPAISFHEKGFDKWNIDIHNMKDELIFSIING